jgi:hypothetical protein
MAALVFFIAVDQVLRNRTGEERLSDLATLAIHKQLIVDRNKVIYVFADRLDRRFQFCRLGRYCIQILYYSE